MNSDLDQNLIDKHEPDVFSEHPARGPAMTVDKVLCLACCDSYFRCSHVGKPDCSELERIKSALSAAGLVRRAENQELPKNPYTAMHPLDNIKRAGYEEGQQQMLKVQPDDSVWMKVEPLEGSRTR